MSRSGVTILLAAWCVLAGLGFWTAMAYQTTSTSVKTPPIMWPASCQLERNARRPTLLVFLHPRCPCSRATFAELNRLLARHRELATIYAIFLRPDTISPGWEKTELWTSMSELPGVRVLPDHHGSYRREFHATVSGECVLYGVDGRLLFHGGITAGRGHEGPNLGADSVAALLVNQHAPANQTPVFGCALDGPTDNQEALP